MILLNGKMAPAKGNCPLNFHFSELSPFNTAFIFLRYAAVSKGMDEIDLEPEVVAGDFTEA